jgi:hypothetical protein
LQHIKNFKIFNDYGSIRFKKEVDVVGLNIDKIVNISQNYICLYEGNPPQEGNGLNTAARIKLKNYIIPEHALNDESDFENFIMILKEKMNDFGVKYKF